MDLLLENQELLDLGEDLRGVEITCRTGCCWLTQAGDSRDLILHAGQSHIFTRRGKVLVTATTSLQLRLKPTRDKADEFIPAFLNNRFLQRQ